MPYTLLFSRTIANDSVKRMVDVPITNRSVMIEILSLGSTFRRVAGYAYALRSDGITDYERSDGITLPFGKNRVNFASATVPYGLEFFPRWGVRSGIISVYTGEPDPLTPVGYLLIPGTPFRVRYNSQRNGGTIERSENQGEWFAINDGGGIEEGYLGSDGNVYVKLTGQGVYLKTAPINSGWESIDVAAYSAAASSGTRIP